MKSVQDLFDLSGRVAIVSSASSGLGVVFAQALADWQKVVDVNLTGVFFCARAG